MSVWGSWGLSGVRRFDRALRSCSSSWDVCWSCCLCLLSWAWSSSTSLTADWCSCKKTHRSNLKEKHWEMYRARGKGLLRGAACTLDFCSRKSLSASRSRSSPHFSFCVSSICASSCVTLLCSVSIWDTRSSRSEDSSSCWENTQNSPARSFC